MYSWAGILDSLATLHISAPQPFPKPNQWVKTKLITELSERNQSKTKQKTEANTVSWLRAISVKPAASEKWQHLSLLTPVIGNLLLSFFFFFFFFAFCFHSLQSLSFCYCRLVLTNGGRDLFKKKPKKPFKIDNGVTGATQESGCQHFAFHFSFLFFKQQHGDSVTIRGSWVQIYRLAR